MPTSKLTSEIITAAIQGFEQQKREIDEQIAELRAMLSGGPAETAVKPRKMTAAALQRLSIAQKNRWAKIKGEAEPEAPTGKRKKFSAVARRRMSLAQKARYARLRGESEPPPPAPAEARKAKRKLSAAARAKLVANLVKARRAKAAKAKSVVTKKTAPAPAHKPKRKLSAAGRAAIIAATKRMWAAKRAAQAKATK
jgi:hypothetical protein